ARLCESVVGEAVALLGACNLGIPIRTGLARCEEVRVPVPEAAVHEHRYTPAREGEIGLPWQGLDVNTPTADAPRPERAAERKLGLRVLRSDPCHDAATGLLGEEVRHSSQSCRGRGRPTSAAQCFRSPPGVTGYLLRPIGAATRGQ